MWYCDACHVLLNFLENGQFRNMLCSLEAQFLYFYIVYIVFILLSLYCCPHGISATNQTLPCWYDIFRNKSSRSTQEYSIVLSEIYVLPRKNCCPLLFFCFVMSFDIKSFYIKATAIHELCTSSLMSDHSYGKYFWWTTSSIFHMFLPQNFWDWLFGFKMIQTIFLIYHILQLWESSHLKCCYCPINDAD